MTEEQLAFFAAETNRAVRKALRRYAKPAIVGYILLMLGVLAAFQVNNNDRSARRVEAAKSREAIVLSGRAVAVSGCNRDYKSIAALRGVLIASKTFQQRQVRDGFISAETFERARKFYDTQLMALQLPDCRDAESLLTDDPDDPIPHIPPLFPKR